MSDEEKKAIKILKVNPEIIADLDEEMFEKMCEFKEKSIKELKYWASQTALNLIEKQSKEIEHQKEKRENQKKELAILNAKQIEFNKLVNTVNSYKGQFKRQQKEIEELKEENKKYIVQLTDEQYRKLVDIIRNEISKEWEDKIKAEIEELEKQDRENRMSHNYLVIPVLQSLLEKE